MKLSSILKCVNTNSIRLSRAFRDRHNKTRANKTEAEHEMTFLALFAARLSLLV
jgi:hypothetical protein